ncbi:hypothetical protein [Verrucomicrobium spinosum]|uniref:hypothetical protein n=1 Tax=Verrucomicrobium spinosum TaxID=2736 RepID=UPI000946853F|nr:hypothetical protein [Verrucomicrobium spinosum]
MATASLSATAPATTRIRSESGAWILPWPWVVGDGQRTGVAESERESQREMREVRGRMAQIVWRLRRLCREEEKGRSRELGLAAPWVLAVARARLQQGLADCEMLDGLVLERLARGEGGGGREPGPGMWRGIAGARLRMMRVPLLLLQRRWRGWCSMCTG